MKTIVAATDFSKPSLNAVKYAADMAVFLNANLVLLHVCQLPLGFSEVPYTIDDIEELQNDASLRINDLKKETGKRTAGKINISTEIKTGTVVTQITEYCESLSPYAVVMGTQGNTAIERLFFGSNTINAMKNISCMLMVIPPAATFTHIKKIGLACDFKEITETLPAQKIKNLVKQFGSQLFVLHVNHDSKKNYQPEIVSAAGVLQEMLEELHPVYHFLNKTDINEALSRFAKDNDLDMLIIVPKKHNIFDQLIHRSQSKKVALHTQVPLLSIHE